MNYLLVFENAQLLSLRIASREQGGLGWAAAHLTSPQPHEASVPSPDLTHCGGSPRVWGHQARHCSGHFPGRTWSTHKTPVGRFPMRTQAIGYLSQVTQQASGEAGLRPHRLDSGSSSELSLWVPSPLWDHPPTIPFTIPISNFTSK